MSQQTASAPNDCYDDEAAAMIARKQILDHVLHESTTTSQNKKARRTRGAAACDDSSSSSSSSSSSLSAASPKKTRAQSQEAKKAGVTTSMRNSKKDILHSPGAFAEEGPSFSSPSDSVRLEDSSSSCVEVAMLPIAASVVMEQEEDDEATKAAVAAQLKELESLRRQVASMTTELQTYKQMQRGDEVVLAQPVVAVDQQSPKEEQHKQSSPSGGGGGVDEPQQEGNLAMPKKEKQTKKTKKFASGVKSRMKRLLKTFAPRSRKQQRRRHGKNQPTQHNIAEGTEASSSYYNGDNNKNHDLVSSINSNDIHSIDWYRSLCGSARNIHDTASADDELLDRMCFLEDDLTDGYMTQ